MATKTCPQCGADVPASAARCKECFHDFSDAPARGVGLLLTLAVFAAMTLIGVVTLALVLSRPVGRDVFVDEATRSVVITTHYRGDKTVSDRVLWDEVTAVEDIMRANGSHEVVAVTLRGERHVLRTSMTSIHDEARDIAKLMDKPLVLVDKSAGYGRDPQASAE